MWRSCVTDSDLDAGSPSIEAPSILGIWPQSDQNMSLEQKLKFNHNIIPILLLSYLLSSYLLIFLSSYLPITLSSFFPIQLDTYHHSSYFIIHVQLHPYHTPITPFSVFLSLYIPIILFHYPPIFQSPYPPIFLLTPYPPNPLPSYPPILQSTDPSSGARAMALGRSSSAQTSTLRSLPPVNRFSSSDATSIRFVSESVQDTLNGGKLNEIKLNLIGLN